MPERNLFLECLQTINQAPTAVSAEDKPPSTEPEEAATRDPILSKDGPLISGLVPPGTPLLPGTNSQFPQEFIEVDSEADTSNPSLGSPHVGSDTFSLDYDATSSDEEVKPVQVDNPTSSLMDRARRTGSLAASRALI